jgi:hypothetical protein
MRGTLLRMHFVLQCQGCLEVDVLGVQLVGLATVDDHCLQVVAKYDCQNTVVAKRTHNRNHKPSQLDGRGLVWYMQDDHDTAIAGASVHPLDKGDNAKLLMQTVNGKLSRPKRCLIT